MAGVTRSPIRKRDCVWPLLTFLQTAESLQEVVFLGKVYNMMIVKKESECEKFTSKRFSQTILEMNENN